MTDTISSTNSLVKPIYTGIRKFLGITDLVISFYAQKCQFKCAYCNLPKKSHPKALSVEIIQQQIDWVFTQYAPELEQIQQLSVGNEGSIIDESRFPKEAMLYLLERTQESLPSLQALSLETRPEYISSKKIEVIQESTQAQILDVTIGFETQDDYIREVILNKTMRKRQFESTVEVLGQLGVRLTTYILLKPSPTMTEEEGVKEAIASIQYLSELTQKYGVNLVIYLNPMYVAKNTPLAREFIKHNYTPVRIQSAFEVVLYAYQQEIPIYTGLWTEKNAVINGDYTCHADYQPEIRDLLKQYNQSQNGELLHPFVIHNS